MESVNAYSVQNSDFIERIDVLCPKCQKKALVIGAMANASRDEIEERVRFSCSSCGYAIRLANTPKVLFYQNSRGKAVYGRVLRMNAPIDPFFGFSVWYQMDTVHGLIWAYNEQHLEVIERHIKDQHRRRSGILYMNRSIGSRLPKGVSSSKNRDYLLKLIQRAKKRS